MVRGGRVPAAKVPIVKFIDGVSGLECDCSVNAIGGRQNSAIVRPPPSPPHPRLPMPPSHWRGEGPTDRLVYCVDLRSGPTLRPDTSGNH